MSAVDRSEHGQTSLTLQRPIPEAFRLYATRLYLEAFWGKLRPFLGRGAPGDDMARVLDLDRAASAFAPLTRLDRGIGAIADLKPNAQLMGLAGFKDAEGGFFDVSMGQMCTVYGPVGGTWRSLLLGLLDRKPAERELLMDGVLVAPEARGRGIGTQLMAAVEDLGMERGAASIRLDVIDTNSDARRLYERLGFEAVATTRVPYLKPLFGFSASTQMRKRLPASFLTPDAPWARE